MFYMTQIDLVYFKDSDGWPVKLPSHPAGLVQQKSNIKKEEKETC